MAAADERCETCPDPVYAKGLCQRHYQKRRYEARRDGTVPVKRCTAKGCGRPLLAKGLCSSCYNAKRAAALRAVARAEERFCVAEGCDVTLKGRAPNTMYCSINCKERTLSARKRQRPGYAEKKKAESQAYAATARDRILRWNYGITAEKYDQMLSDQGGVCAICGDPPNGQRLAVDHDHDCENRTIRGLLCNNCNNGLGRFGDDTARLRAAIAYLEGAASVS